MLYGFFGILQLVNACDSDCFTSCSIFNAPPSCFIACGCTNNQAQIAVPEKLQNSFSNFQKSLFSSSNCSQSDFYSCEASTILSRYSKCLVASYCENFATFAWLIKNIPNNYWLAVSPYMLITLVEDDNDQADLEQFDKEQRYCYGDFLDSVSRNMQDSRFIDCISNSGSEISQELQRNCKIRCKNECGVDNKDCFQSCMSDECDSKDFSSDNKIILINPLPMIEEEDFSYGDDTVLIQNY